MPGCLTKLSRHLFRYRMVCVEQNQLVHIIKGRLFQWHESCLRYIVYLSFIFNLGTHPVGVQCFSFAFFFHILVISCVIVFSRVLSLRLKYVQFCSLSLDCPLITIGECQSLDWLWYPLTCGPRGGAGVNMEQKS